MRVNALSSPELRRGQRLRIPAALLHAAFRVAERSQDGALEYGSDDQGPFAAYRLRPGEALYSSVVVRFTGRTGAEDVVALAERIRERSGIPDLHDIPVSFAVKIPLELLEPDHLPPDHPRRLEAQAERAELAKELAADPVARPARGLAGVLVILDPGHGGRDMGTMKHGVWEHDYVYDVACRLKQLLVTETAAEVVMTLEDDETGCVPSREDRLVANRQGTIRTVPPFLAREEGEAAIGVNLRWYLSNSVYRAARGRGVDPDRVLFLSLHADSRHPALRGVMVYVAGAGLAARTYGSSSHVYARYREVREQTHVRFSKKERVRSEALSTKLAQAIVASFRRFGLPVQTYQPVRNKIIRGRSEWVPAVLGGNAVPNKVLVELVNIANAEDALLLGAASKRDDLARGLLAALFDHFGERPTELAASAAAP
jgi:N-acetylmuramoyl-L-alanine amidase